MATEVRLDKVSPELEYATVQRWLKDAGDQISAGEPLLEVEADKVNVEIAAPASGTLAEIVALEGDEVAVGALLAMIEPS